MRATCSQAPPITFLPSPALQRTKFVDFRLNLETETIERVFSADPLCVEPTTTIREVFRLLRDKHRGAVLVCKNQVLVGIFTERDALVQMAKGGDYDQPIETVMVRQPMTVPAGTKVADAITKMSHGGYRRLPVVDDQGRPIGVLKVSGILRYFVEHFPQVIYTLPPQPHHAMQEREGA
jgi:FOG: CBS domain